MPLLLLLLLLAGPALGAPVVNPQDLVQGGYVLYFRHGHAERGQDCKDPNQSYWWRSHDPSLTRQLDDQGRNQAAVIGTGLRAAGIQVDQVRASEFRRAVETAESMSLGPVIVERDLTPLSSYGALEPRLNECLNRRPAPGTVNVLVAHGHVTELFSHLNEGDAAVFRPGPNGPTFVGFLRYQAWQH
ncbi:MAG: histidine phosphatase family protein [Vulcanimicrobiota bacterium]